MWRFVRIIEKKIIVRTGKEEPIYLVDCSAEFCLLKSIFGRNYTVDDAFRAELMADKKGYIGAMDKTVPFNKKEVGISGDGVAFTSVTSLINELAKSIASVSTLAAVLIAALALYVSIHKR